VWPACPVLPGCTPVYRGTCLKCRYLPRYYRGHDLFVKKCSKVAKKLSKIVKKIVKNGITPVFTPVFTGIFRYYPYLPVFTGIYRYLPVLPVFTGNTGITGRRYLAVFTGIYPGIFRYLPVFTPVLPRYLPRYFGDFGDPGISKLATGHPVIMLLSLVFALSPRAISRSCVLTVYNFVRYIQYLRVS